MSNRHESFFEVLKKEGLTHLEIHYDWKEDKNILYSAKEWDKNIKWRYYNKKFTQFTLLTDNALYYNHSQTRELLEKNGLSDYLSEIIDLMRKGRHTLLDFYYWEKENIRFVNNIHSDRKGLNNLRSSIVMGGIRRHEPDEEEKAVLIDGMNLGRAMTFKNEAAKIPMGGCKITVQMKPINLEDLDQVGFLAYANDRTRNIAGPDMRFPTELADVENTNFSLNFAGGPNAPLGETGMPTAYGTYIAVKQGSKFLWGSESLKSKKIAVQGLGAVGYYLAEYYIKEGAEIIVCDMDQSTIKAFREAHPEAPINVVNPDEIYYVDADIFSPSAIGGIVTQELIPKMKFKLIMGPANNQLEASSQEEEYELAKQLDEAGILFQVDWWHNVGGVMSGFEEYTQRENASMSKLLSRIKEICTYGTWSNLNKAHKQGITPTEMAYKTVENEIYG